jgi:hypothetical protein
VGLLAVKSNIFFLYLSPFLSLSVNYGRNLFATSAPGGQCRQRAGEVCRGRAAAGLARDPGDGGPRRGARRPGVQFLGIRFRT